MNAYRNLAESYDRLTRDVDYEATVAFYDAIMKQSSFVPESVLDLGCGTGSVAVLLARSGKKVTAVDMSEDMLCQAQQKAFKQGVQITFVHQKMHQLRLPYCVDLAVSALDSINYIIRPADCAAAFQRVYKYLNPGGMFIFDVNTPEKLRAMDGQIFLDEDKDVYCVWRGAFSREENICSYGMDLFQKKGNTWRRSFEEHREYAYTVQELTQYLENAGFRDVAVFADRCLEPPRPGEQRVYFRARKEA